MSLPPDTAWWCHVCGEPGEVLANGRLVGVPWCSARCERSAMYKAGDMVVLDSGYTNDVNGIPFRVKEELGNGRFRGSVRGQVVEFIREQACKVGTKRAETIINKRKLYIGGKYGKA